MKTLVLASALFAGLLFSVGSVPVPPGPYSPFCRTIWLFATPCDKIRTTLLQQIQAFNPLNGCADCQYMLVSATSLSIKANHTSLDSLQSENITLSFGTNQISGTCYVSALSSSLGLFSLLDNGLNYCNLYKLLSASGLISEPGFTEMTNEWACLGYGLAPCKPPKPNQLY